MIPQGEFKKLLNSKSDEKEEIFRKIFGTEIFEKIQRDLKDQSIKLRKAVDQVSRDRLVKIRSFICKENDKALLEVINEENINIEFIMKNFNEFIKNDKVEQALLEKKIDTSNKLLEKTSKNLAVAEETNKKFILVKNKKDELETLTKLIKEFEEKKSILRERTKINKC